MYGIGKKGYRCYDPISKRLHVSQHVIFWEHKMFYQLPHVPVSPISSIDLFLEESPTSISEPPTPLVSEFPPSIFYVPSHASDEPPTPIIDVPTDPTSAVDPAGPSNSHALHRSHWVTTLPSHLRHFRCFSTLASLQEPQTFHEVPLTLYGGKL